MKYYIVRKSKLSKLPEEYKMHKCLDNWCGLAYLKKYPDRVWQFSKSGANKIVERMNKLYGWDAEFYAVPVDEIINV